MILNKPANNIHHRQPRLIQNLLDVGSAPQYLLPHSHADLGLRIYTAQVEQLVDDGLARGDGGTDVSIRVVPVTFTPLRNLLLPLHNHLSHLLKIFLIKSMVLDGAISDLLHEEVEVVLRFLVEERYLADDLPITLTLHNPCQFLQIYQRQQRSQIQYQWVESTF